MRIAQQPTAADAYDANRRGSPIGLPVKGQQDIFAA